MIHEETSLNLCFSVSSPLQGYDESYTDTAYESYDSYYNQPQAWVNQTSLWLSPAFHTVHTRRLVASFTWNGVWEQQKYFLATLQKVLMVLQVWMTAVFSESQPGLGCSVIESQALILFVEANYCPSSHYSQQLLDVFQILNMIFLFSMCDH